MIALRILSLKYNVCKLLPFYHFERDTSMSTRSKFPTLMAFGLAIGMIFLEQSGVGVTLDKMKVDLGLSTLGVHWVMNAYLLTLSVTLLAGGRIGDYFGSRRVFIIGMLIFMIAAIVCATSTGVNGVIVGRFLQGIGASLLIPNTFALLRKEFDPSQVGKAMGTCVAFGSFFLAAGPFIGGTVTELGNWRWIFWINVPVALLCLYFIYNGIAKDQPRDGKQSFDLHGAIAFTLSLCALVVGLMEAPSFGWLSLETVGLIIIAILGFVYFIKVEQRKAHPLFELALFKNKAFLSGIIILFCLQVIVLSITFWALWLQQSLHYSPMMAGILLLPASAPIIFMAPLTGRWNDSKGPYLPIRVGTLLCAIGLFWVGLSALSENYYLMIPGIFMVGLAIPITINTSILVVIGQVIPAKTGMASGMYNTLRQVGGSMTFAIVGSIMISAQNYLQANHVSHFITKAFSIGVFTTFLFGIIAVLFAFFGVKIRQHHM